MCMDVGNQIGERRRVLGLSQGELAQRLYVSRVTVSSWETGRTLPDVQSMLLLANLFGTTIDELVRGDVDEMREMEEKGEQQRKAFAIALGAVEVTVIAVLAFMATAGRDYLDSALRLLLAVLVLASSVVTLVARRGGGNREAKSAAELLGAASGDPVEAARENARANGLANCEFLAGDVLKVVDGLTQKPDLIVLDPPRDGIHPKAIGKIIRFGVQKMVYIACKPTSLARDLELLQGRGYQVERMACVDLFPGTYHTECVCLLNKK